MEYYGTQNLIITIIGYVFGAGGLLFWFLERRKFNAEVEAVLENVNASKIDNDVKLSHHYKEILDDLKERYEKKFEEFEKMWQAKEKLMKDELSLLRKQIRNLKSELRIEKQKNKRIEG